MANNITRIPNESKLAADSDDVVFLMVPFPAQSHLNQLLRLSHLIRSRGFPVHYAASAIHCRQVKLRHDTLLLNTSGIIFHELLTPPFNSPPPNPYSSVKYPQHIWPSFEASLNLREPVAALLRELSSSSSSVAKTTTRTRTRTRRLVIIHDYLMNYVVQDAASVPNAESYSFSSGSTFCTFCITRQLSGKPFPVVELEPEAIPNLDNCFIPEVVKFLSIQNQYEHLKHGTLFSTCRAVEGPYLDLLAQTTHADASVDKKTKQWAIAPLFPVTANNDDDKAHPTLEWLDKQPPKSVIYVSFGSLTTMSQEQINELALGLEESKQRFIWVLRDADRGNIFNAESTILPLPEGFEERVKGVGKVTRDWAPQLGILRHPSVGGFMSHCGWNSCLESLTMGVPLATWPMHSDQPHNALLMTHILKVGVQVMGWGERDQLITSSVIQKSIENLMASSEGHAVRTRAEELGKIIKQSVDDDHWELNSFLTYATRSIN
ncbi:zeatin O-glucosyltransferase-like [Impatiens glandulifera]|uniref:zeatin O-glucosyltransferase-like n=1 Tax=Impatiens glandulifera TaxID=253017 RepID=UPI001FB18200|nr:zeatin O-glucosyltransferase-like [Impatiens glandulifera]